MTVRNTRWRAGARTLQVWMLVAMSLAVAAPAWAQSWKKLSSEDGIIVEIREVPDQELPDLRGTVVIKAELYEVAALIEDVDHTCDWAKRCMGSRVLKRINDAEMLFYSRTVAPWPVQDRDAALHALATGIDRGDEVTMKFETIQTSLMPPIDGVVRMPTMRGHYKLWRIDDQNTRVEFQVHADIGGNIPNWLSAMLSKSIPYDTLAGIRRHLPKARARYAETVAKWLKTRAETLAAANAPARQP